MQSCLLHCNKIYDASSSMQEEDANTGEAGRKRRKLPYYHLYHHAVVQMGGGCILYTKNLYSRIKRSSSSTSTALKPIILKAADVLPCMCDCIFSSKEYGDAGVLKSICSIVLQRVSCMTTLSQDDTRHACGCIEQHMLNIVGRNDIYSTAE